MQRLTSLLGTKIVLTELVPYKELARLVDAGGVTPRTETIAGVMTSG